jgi:hypothetical protein
MRHIRLLPLVLSVSLTPALHAQGQQAAAAPSRADSLRGGYGPFRANNDLTFYHLDIRVDPARKYISGKNTIQFRMLADGNRIQIDLHPSLTVDSIVQGTSELMYERDASAVFITFPATLRKGREYSIDFHYSGNPLEIGRGGGGIGFRTDANGVAFINTVCEGVGSSGVTRWTAC